MSAVSAPLLFEREGALARLTLNRPEAGNAIDLAQARALMDAAIRCDEDESIRCVLLTGNGRLFCAGGDVACFAAAGDDLPILVQLLTAHLHMAQARFARMAKPMVVAVNGPAAGAGCGLAMIGDLVLASESAHFTLAYTGIGLSPDGGSSWLLPRLVGLRKAQELVLTNKRVSATEALALGLVTRVVDASTLQQEAGLLAAQLARGATAALGRSRALLRASFETSLETQLESEAQSIAALSRTPQAREGIAAFMARRQPDFLPKAAA